MTTTEKEVHIEVFWEFCLCQAIATAYAGEDLGSPTEE